VISQKAFLSARSIGSGHNVRSVAADAQSRRGGRVAAVGHHLQVRIPVPQAARSALRHTVARTQQGHPVTEPLRVGKVGIEEVGTAHAHGVAVSAPAQCADQAHAVGDDQRG